MNNFDFDVVTSNAQNVGIGEDNKKKLKGWVETIEKLENQKVSVNSDIRDVFLIAKAAGFDTKIIKQVLRLRKKEKEEREEELSILDNYLHALGMI